MHALVAARCATLAPWRARRGGGVQAMNGAQATVDSCSFQDMAGYGVGSIMSYYGSLTLTNSLFVNSSAGDRELLT